MKTHSPLARSVRMAIALGATATALPTFAQEQENAADNNVEKIEVTGSRIKRTDLETPTPVTVISIDDIKKLGLTNVADILARNPVAIAASDQSNVTFSGPSAGLSTTALRNLESQRTLVLVNGRRFVSGVAPGTGYAVDLNAIPTAIVERIEILKSASSAVYGSDAVAGVVNIITKRDFEGVAVNWQKGQASEGDRDRDDIDVTFGKSWNGGNAWMSLGYSRDEGLLASDRAFSQFDLAGYDLDGDGVGEWGWLGSSFLPQGRFGGFLGDGTPFRSGLNDRENSDRFNRASFRQLVIPLERRFAAGQLTMELSDNLSVFSEFNFSQTASASQIEPPPLDLFSNVWENDIGGTGGLSVESPLINDGLRNALLGAGITDLAQLGNNNTARRLTETGPRGSTSKRDTIRIATGFEYAINDNWVLDGFLVWGETTQNTFNEGDINTERVLEALTVEVVDGELRCVDEVARIRGCVPFNIFGENTLSQEAIDYVTAPSKLLGRVSQLNYGINISGELGIELGGGNIAIAAGYEFREEQGQENPGDLAQIGANFGNRTAPTDGRYDVNELFVEARFPILDNLAVDAAIRTGDYSTIDTITTWNLGVEFNVTDQVMLRASGARAVRAPNVSDLFAGQGETFATLTDPCNGIDANTPGTVAENCRSIPAIANRIANTGSFTLTQVEIQSPGGFLGGNPNVQEEEADTFSIGVVAQIIDGLSVTADWYDIEIDNAITITPRSTVLDRCFNAPTSSFDASCNSQSRRDLQTGALTGVDSLSSNENVLETSGLDLEVAYNFKAFGGEGRFDFQYNYLDTFDTTGILDGDLDEDAGEVLYPENRFVSSVNYSIGNFDAFWSMRFWDAVKDSNTRELQDENGAIGGDGSLPENLNSLGSVFYHDMQVGYQVNEQIRAYLGINNVFDKQPPLLAQITQYGSTGINTAPEAYDVTGRFYYLGVQARF